MNTACSLLIGSFALGLLACQSSSDGSDPEAQSQAQEKSYSLDGYYRIQKVCEANEYVFRGKCKAEFRLRIESEVGGVEESLLGCQNGSWETRTKLQGLEDGDINITGLLSSSSEVLFEGNYQKDSGNSLGAITLHSVEDFEQLRDLDRSSFRAELCQDIDFENIPFVSIESFGGDFDGNGRTIRNLGVGTSRPIEGLFRELGDTSSVKNLNLEDFNLSGFEVGALARIAYGEIENVHARNIQIDASNGAGGLVGLLSGVAPDDRAVIRNSSVTAENLYPSESEIRSQTGDVGGLVGFARRYITIEDVLVENLHVLGEGLDSNDRSYVGGIVGRSFFDVDIHRASFNGLLFAQGQVQRSSQDPIAGDLDTMLGGIVGFSQQASNEIRNCLAFPEFTRVADPDTGFLPHAGGIVGGAVFLRFSAFKNNINLGPQALVGALGTEDGSEDIVSVWRDSPTDYGANIGVSATDQELRSPDFFINLGYDPEIWTLEDGEYPRLTF